MTAAVPPTSPEARSRRDGIAAVVVAGAALALYVRTLTPGLAHSGVDGHELTWVATTLGLAHPTGYPLFTWLGFLATKLLPVGEPAYRTNLLSAALGAGGVGLLYLVGRRLALSPLAAGVAALGFATAGTFWSQAVVTEVYAPNLFMVALGLLVLLGRRPGDDRRLALFALLFGLALGTHLSNLGFAPAYAGFVLLTDPHVLKRPRAVLAAGGAFLLGAAQFLWLPYRAGALDLFPNAPPDTPARLVGYTVGAFSGLRFAFPLAAVPDRLAAYVALLVDDLTPLGPVLALVGAAALLRRNLAAFWLLALMWLVHVAFFTQLHVPDPAPFFIPSLLVVALLVGAGLQAARDAVDGALARHAGAGRAAVVATAAALLLVVPLATRVPASARANDRSRDTAVGDFYAAVFDVLPRGSVLASVRGAWGSAVRYRRRFHDARPDLHVPAEPESPRPPADAPLYSTEPAPPVGMPRGILPERGWYVPVLLGSRRDLVLYRVTAAPPPLATLDGRPSVRLERRIGEVTLVGYDLGPVRSAPPARVRLTTYWRGASLATTVVSTRVADVTLEAHRLAFGNLPRWTDEMGPLGPDAVVVEDVEVVLPSWLPRGDHPLAVGVVGLDRDGIAPHWTPVGAARIE